MSYNMVLNQDDVKIHSHKQLSALKSLTKYDSGFYNKSVLFFQIQHRKKHVKCLFLF